MDDTAARSAGHRKPWAVFAVLAVCQFVVVLDAEIVYVALPSFARIGPVDSLLAAMVLQALGLAWWAALGPDSYPLTSFVLPGVLWGVGCGAGIVAGFVVCTGGVHGPAMGAASGLVSTTLQVGGALGVATLSVIAYRQRGSAGAIDSQLLVDGQAAALLAAAIVAAAGIPLVLWLRSSRSVGDHASSDMSPAH